MHTAESSSGVGNWGGLQQLAEADGVVQQKRFEERIVERSSGVEYHPETFDETRRAQVHFGQNTDGSLAVDGHFGIEACGKDAADFLRRVDFEGEEQIVAKCHRGIKTFWVWMGNRNFK